ncbi:MAG: DUF2141 domain-containing protein [Bacteroidota bacterium]
MATRLLSLIILTFFWSFSPAELDPALSVQCRVDASEWSKRTKNSAWLISLRRADGTPIEELVIAATRNPQVLELGERRPGTYVVAAYFDTNGNRKLDRGVFSNPTEPYAFSNNARNRFSEPDLSAQRFTHPGTLQRLELKPAF